MEFKLRAANQNEAQYLSDLASRSKSFWPYDAEYLALCRSVTHVTKEDIEKWPFTVATLDKTICGFAAIAEVDGEKMLDHMWIEPEFIGKGLGKILFQKCIADAKNLGWTKFTIAADPYAEKFYLKMGCNRIGQKESKIKKGFFLPLLEYFLN